MRCPCKESVQPMFQLLRATGYLIAILATLGGAGVAAAQSAPGGPCDLVSDAMIAPAHAIQGLNAPGLESCAVQDGAAAPVAIYHISGPIDPDELAVPGAPPSALASSESAAVDGVGDSALLQRGTIDGKAVVSLRVQRADEVFAFITEDSPGVADRLIALAKVVLGS